MPNAEREGALVVLTRSYRLRTPKLVGPLQGGVHGWPFGAPTEDLEARGYVMEEFVVEGFAGRYRADPRATAPDENGVATRCEGAEPFRTRVYVLTPKDPSAFNGVLIVNWQNVSRKMDVGAPDGDEVYRGYAWAGVTAQKLGIDGRPGETPGLADWDALRYRGLTHPGDAYSYDIFAQIACLLRDGPGEGRPDPMRGMRARMLIAAGRSQSAMRLGSYLNLGHAHDRLFDAFLLTVHFGLCPPLEETEFESNFTADDDGRFPAQARLRDDGKTKTLALSTECEALYNFGARQPDTNSYRFWEIAGAAHSNPQRDAALERILARDGVSQAGPSSAGKNTLEYQPIKDAALRWLTRWHWEGSAPPCFPRLLIEPGPDGRLQLRRDRFGNAIGGLRLPAIAAATGAFEGRAGGDFIASLVGASRSFSLAEMVDVHGSEAGFRRTWREAVARLETLHLLTVEEAHSLRDAHPWPR